MTLLALKPPLTTPEDVVNQLFCNDGFWRIDSHILVWRLTALFQKLFEELPRVAKEEKWEKFDTLSAKCAVLVKIHWSLCSKTGVSSNERQEDAERLLNYIGRIGKDHGRSVITANFFNFASKEEAVVNEVVRQLSKNIPMDVETVDDEPLIGSLAQMGPDGGVFRGASSLGIAERLHETSDRTVMDRFISAHELLMNGVAV